MARGPAAWSDRPRLAVGGMVGQGTLLAEALREQRHLGGLASAGGRWGRGIGGQACRASAERACVAFATWELAPDEGLRRAGADRRGRGCVRDTRPGLDRLQVDASEVDRWPTNGMTNRRRR